MLYFNSFVNLDSIFRNNQREELALQHFANRQMLITLFTSVEAPRGSGSFAVADLLSSVRVNVTFIHHCQKSYLY